MKFSKLSQLFLVSTVGLLVATLLSACQLVTIDYVYVASSAATSGTNADGQINIFAVDSQSGALRSGATTVSSGGATPVAMAVSADYSNLYVAHSGDNTVVHFAVATNGTLTNKDTITLSVPPAALAVSPDGAYLYVLAGSTSATLNVYSLSSGTIGALASSDSLVVSGAEGDQMVPTGLAVLASGKGVYATAYDKSSYNPGGTTSSTEHPGWVFGFAASSGTLTAASGSPYQAGVKPSAIASDPTNRFVYVTDWASNQLIGYTIGTSGTLNYLVNGPFKTGNEPSGVAVDPRGKYIYVTNALDNDLSAYEITLATGSPSTIVNSGTTSVYGTDTQPVALAIDPALGRFVYTTNHLGNSVSGFRLNADNGTLVTTQATPYPTNAYPTALAIVPHGNHSLQSVAKN